MQSPKAAQKTDKQHKKKHRPSGIFPSGGVIL